MYSLVEGERDVVLTVVVWIIRVASNISELRALGFRVVAVILAAPLVVGTLGRRSGRILFC
jgi:hypothetical protein